MGNKNSCCVYHNSKSRNKKQRDGYLYQNSRSSLQEGPGGNYIQPLSSNSLLVVSHISEREPEDSDNDPSSHPAAKPLFSAKAEGKLKRNSKTRHRNRMSISGVHRHHIDEFGQLRKFSSCSTIFIDDSTVSQPNLKTTIKSVVLAIYCHVRSRVSTDDEVEKSQAILEPNVLLIFDEKAHPLSKEPVPDDYQKRDPEHKIIYRFVRNLFHAAQLTAECAIVALVYLERLLTYSELNINPGNWKRMVLGAIILASKVWDDQAVWNVDFCQILKDIQVDDMNELERQVLELLQFNINVPSSVYAKYYFDLRALTDVHELALRREPLDKERALKLEALSSVCEDKQKLWHRKNHRRIASLDSHVWSLRRPRAILS